MKSQQPNQRQKKQKPKMYWKDALRLAQQTAAEEATPRQRQQWANAARKAEADMAGAKRGEPEAVVWMPEEVVRVIRQAEPAPQDNPDPAPTRPQSPLPLTALLFGSALLILPSAISYVRAYRKITNRPQ
jgi:hypothetical protein